MKNQFFRLIFHVAICIGLFAFLCALIYLLVRGGMWPKERNINMSESKYQSQMKNLRKNYVRFPLDLKPDVLEAFRAACEKNGTKATTEIKKFINQIGRAHV